ncbi:MAG: hypothetical protein DPW13_09410 [Planctomycetes bacterium]|nr:hypothetical protein [Planctomycetota bacterium]
MEVSSEEANFDAGAGLASCGGAAARRRGGAAARRRGGQPGRAGGPRRTPPSRRWVRRISSS